MQWLVAAVALAGCNQVFNLSPAINRDADLQFFDAPADAPFSCPTAGTLPRFKRNITQAILQTCHDYTLSRATGRALAMCSELTTGIYEGAIDELMHPALGFVPPTGFMIERARLAADGDLAIAKIYDVNINYKHATYVRTIDGVWQWVNEPNIPTSYATSFSPVSRGPAHRVFVMDQDLVRYEEWAQQDLATWQLVDTYSLADLGVDYLADVRLAPDALRMLFWGRVDVASPYRVLYVDRRDLSSRFSKAVALDTVPPMVTDPSITDDCGRIYFGALDSVFHLQQE
jgi:hypothetical protein